MEFYRICNLAKREKRDVLCGFVEKRKPTMKDIDTFLWFRGHKLRRGGGGGMEYNAIKING